MKRIEDFSGRRVAHVCVALAALIAIGFAAREASADTAPKSIASATITPVYWNGASEPVNAEVQDVMPSFYADFTGQLVSSPYGGSSAPQNATQVVGEYGVQAFTLNDPYTVSVTAPLTQGSGVFVTPCQIAGMLGAEITSGGLQAPLCNNPQSGSTSYSGSLYVVHLPPDTNVTVPPGNNPNDPSCPNAGANNSPCSTVGYHLNFGFNEHGTNGSTFTCYAPFVVVLDVSPANGNGCDPRVETSLQSNGVNFGAINSYTYGLSHELFEALTNPFNLAETEIADKCQSSSPGGLTNLGAPWNTLPANGGPPWLIASTFSAKSNTCWVGEQALNVNLRNNGYVSITNGSEPAWGWDAEAYKSSGFAVDRGPSHIDVFAVKATEAGLNTWTRQWDTAFPPAAGGINGWTVIQSAWGSSASGPGLVQDLTALDAVATAPVGSPVTAVAPSPTWIAAVVAGNNRQVSLASCTSGDGCRTTGTWSDMASITPTSGTYQVAPGTPISAVYPPAVLGPLSLFFAGSNGELFALEYTLFGWTLTTVAPAGTLPTSAHNSAGKAFVSAIARWEVVLKAYEYDVFVADATGAIRLYNSEVGGSGWTSSVIAGASSVEPGTPIAALTRVPGQIDLFAVDAKGAVQSYWWNELAPTTWNQVTNLMPAGTTSPGAGIAAVGWANHMVVVTTTTSAGQQGVATQTFEELTGWQGAPAFQAATFTLGIQLQAVSPYRDRVDVLGMESDGTVQWIGMSSQYAGLTLPDGCTGPVDCAGTWTAL